MKYANGFYWGDYPHLEPRLSSIEQSVYGYEQPWLFDVTQGLQIFERFFVDLVVPDILLRRILS